MKTKELLQAVIYIKCSRDEHEKAEQVVTTGLERCSRGEHEEAEQVVTTGLEGHHVE